MIENVEPKANLFVIGELVLESPTRDSGGKEGDMLIVLGEPIWGNQSERFEKAKKLFDCWFEILGSGAGINASKDVTKGGLIATVMEIAEKSGLDYELDREIPFHLSRNLDNFLISVDEKNAEKILKICSDHGLSAIIVGGLKKMI